MDSWKDVTLGDVAKALSRYRPFIIAVASILVVAILLPGRGDNKETVASGAGLQTGDNAGASEEITDTTLAPDAATPGVGNVAGGVTRATGPATK